MGFGCASYVSTISAADSWVTQQMAGPSDNRTSLMKKFK
jgi:hypothetical protein